MELTKEEIQLREEILQALERQGLSSGNELKEQDKELLKRVQQQSRLDKIMEHKKFLIDSMNIIKKYCKNGSDINPELIDLELREVKSGSFEETIFKWWNLVWWNMPYQRPCGRQMRFLLWDKTHDVPFGLIGLQSPPLAMSARDQYLNLPKNDLDIWVNMSMGAQRLGALPPYNVLLGGKMVAMAVTCNAIVDAYKNKYKDYKTKFKDRQLSADLLFITTTSAFGKSSLYNRLRYKDEKIAISLGYTKGAGSFHIPKPLFKKIILYLKGKNNESLNKILNRQPIKTVQVLNAVSRHLYLPSLDYHNVKRELFLFPLVKNLDDVIHKGEQPIYYDRQLDNLLAYWKERYALPRSERMPEWRNFDANEFFAKVERLFEEPK